MTDLGLLMLRVFVGSMMLIGHGWGKLQNFSTLAERFPDPLGMGSSVGLAFAVFAEVFCAFAIMIGFATRFAAVPLFIVMGVAGFLVHSGDPWAKKELAFVYWSVFGALIFTGPGKLSVDGLLEKSKRSDTSSIAMRFFSWNVNGIRSCENKGFLKWFSSHGADIVSLQEIKITEDKLDFFLRNPASYHSYWNFAQRPGYSGVAVFTRKEPESVQMGIGDEELDTEGRALTLEFPDFFLVNAYFPNSGRDHLRLQHKLRFCKKMQSHLKRLVAKGKEVVICGDFNIAHQEIDLKNPKSNQNNAGFLPQERAWMTQFLKAGFSDVFRRFQPGPDHYTWWSYRPGVRERNIGWRLDYHCVSEGILDRVKDVGHQPEVLGSDHCPVFLELKR